MDRTILVAVAIIVFFAGFGVGSVVFYNQPNVPILGHGMTGFVTSPETMNQMMQDPDFRNEWANWMVQDTEHMNQMMQDNDFRSEMLEFMIQDTDHMNQWMLEDPQHNTMMIEEMKTNHDFMMGIAVPMIQDPGLRLQVMGHMTESPEAMAQLQQMMGGGMTGQTMMSSESMREMMEDPETRNKMIELMSPHITEMQELLSSELSDEEFDTKMNEIMEKHHQALRVLMHDEPLGHDESMDNDEHP
jgi:hypothetical protein